MKICPRCKRRLHKNICNCSRRRVNETPMQAINRCQHQLRMDGYMTRRVRENTLEEYQERIANQLEASR